MFTCYHFGYRAKTVPLPTPPDLCHTLECMKEHSGVSPVLYDCRWSPNSGNPVWFKDGSEKLPGLRQRLGTSRYLHVPDLGNPHHTQGTLGVKNLRRGLDLLRIQLTHNSPVVLLCACGDFQSCHRKLVCDAIAAEGFKVAALKLQPVPAPPPAQQSLSMD